MTTRFYNLVGFPTALIQRSGQVFTREANQQFETSQAEAPRAGDKLDLANGSYDITQAKR